jgi:hypothetical protein
MSDIADIKADVDAHLCPKATDPSGYGTLHGTYSTYVYYSMCVMWVFFLSVFVCGRHVSVGGGRCICAAHTNIYTHRSINGYSTSVLIFR